MPSTFASHAFLRPSHIIIFLLLSLLIASCLFVIRQKSDFTLSFHKPQSSNYPWPNSQFWEKLSREPRSTNRCSYSGCPLHTSGQNRSQFSDPFNLKLATECPFYFRWIHEDLAPWRKSGISRTMLDSARPLASFRVVIKSGRLYVDPYASCFQTRAIFTIWGLLQLLKFYPGLVPDVDLLFGCGDRPQVLRKHYNGKLPSPVFRYCSSIDTFDIPFPDWSFWGWPEVGLRPWDAELCGILKGQNEILWEKRHPTAFWKGNTDTGGALRKELRNCNGRYGAQIYHQDWHKEIQAHLKNSRLAQQCKHRYKIYVEGWGWSVSLKYILACDSPTLLVDAFFFDFFSRGLVPKEHFWPVRRNKLCQSIKFGVDWGNNHSIEAESMGRSGRQFMTEKLSMKHVYDYMLYSLREYAKLLRYEPTIGNLTELCSETFLCQATDQEKPLYEESIVKAPSDVRPCSLPPRDEGVIKASLEQRLNTARQIQQEEDRLWRNP